MLGGRRGAREAGAAPPAATGLPRLDLGAIRACNVAESGKKRDMNAEHPRFETYPGGLPGRSDEAPGREYQELWFALARLQWASVVLVPADRGGSAADVATALAEVGTRLRDTPVTAIVASRMDYASVRALADLQPRLHAGGSWLAPVETAGAADGHGRPGAPAGRSKAGTARGTHSAPPIGRAIIAIQSVVEEPLGVAVAQAADAVVLCVELGRTRASAARRTVDLIGPERVVGAVIVRRPAGRAKR